MFACACCHGINRQTHQIYIMKSTECWSVKIYVLYLIYLSLFLMHVFYNYRRFVMMPLGTGKHMHTPYHYKSACIYRLAIKKN